MIDPRTAPLERKYRTTAHLYDILDWPWERQYRMWRPSIVGDVQGRVIEVGVGTGRNLAYYPEGVDLTAVDLSEAMLARARRRGSDRRPAIDFRQGDALDLRDLPSGRFDWYIATFLYCVLPDALQSAALAEMTRLLAPGGRFRLVEILYSSHPLRRLPQKLLSPLVQAVYGARFDRRTLEHLEGIPELEITAKRWLRGDSYLLVEGRKRGALPDPVR